MALAKMVTDIKNKILDFINMLANFQFTINGKIANIILAVQRYLMNKDIMARSSVALATFLRVTLGLSFAYQGVLKISMAVLLGVLYILLNLLLLFVCYGYFTFSTYVAFCYSCYYIISYFIIYACSLGSSYDFLC